MSGAKPVKRSHEENARREGIARDVMRVYRRVKNDETRLRSAQSMMPLIIAILRSGITPDVAPDLSSVRMSAAQQWLVSIHWILREIGPVSSFILEARLTRRQRSPEASYEQIAADLLARGTTSMAKGVPMSREAIQALYFSALDLFVDRLEERGLTPDYGSAIPQTPVASRSDRLPAVLERMSIEDAISVLRRVTLLRTQARRRTNARAA